MRKRGRPRLQERPHPFAGVRTGEQLPDELHLHRLSGPRAVLEAVVHCLLHGTHGERWLPGDAVRQRHRGGVDATRWHHIVDEPNLQRLRRVQG